MSFNEAAFLKRYNKLNEQQKEAVDIIYGPVMVIPCWRTRPRVCQRFF